MYIRVYWMFKIKYKCVLLFFLLEEKDFFISQKGFKQVLGNCFLKFSWLYIYRIWSFDLQMI